MKNPPRTTTIKGQKHLLAYITPDEAKLLKAMGGSGESVNGIPAFYGGFDDDRTQAGESSDFSGAEGGYDSGGVADDNDGQPMGMSPGAMGGAIGSSYQQAPSVGDGFDVNLNKAMSRIAMAPPDQKLNFVDRAIMKAYQNRTQPGLLGDILGLPLGRTQGFTLTNDPRKGIFSGFSNQAPMVGTLGFLGELFPSIGEKMYVRTGFDTTPQFDDGSGPDDTVPATTNPVTGEKQCPDGYMFDEDLQACRLAGGLPGGDGQVMTTSGPYEAGDYARMGLLDIAPMGMSLFADRYGIPQMDFDTSNLAFRRGGATRPQYFRQAPDLTGYTLLS
jgi:hypothetical protein